MAIVRSLLQDLTCFMVELDEAPVSVRATGHPVLEK